MIVGALKPYEQGTALLHVILDDSGRLGSGITLNCIVQIDHPFSRNQGLRIAEIQCYFYAQ